MNKEFIWGVATAAYQIEGAYNEDGKGESIWDAFSHTPGKIAHGETGDIACDHYHRYKDDVRLMAELGVKSYRFSVAWTRILPEGIGKINEKGVAFYDDLINELLRYGIEPCLTLYHWDFPQKLFEKGYWLNDESPEWFAEYAKIIGERFGGKVKYFITINEPQCIMGGLNGSGHAPSLKLSLKDRFHAAHNILKAHGAAVRALRKTAPHAKIGYAPCAWVIVPKDDSEKEIEIARKGYFNVWEHDPFAGPTFFTDPIILGDYPKELYEKFGNILPKITKEDLKLISEPIDFLGQNIYSGAYAAEKENGEIEWQNIEKQGAPRNSLGWNIVPQSLYWGAKFLYERYKKPLIITENGYPNADVICLDGKIHDAERIDYVERHLLNLKRAISEGVPVLGYYYWSFMDNMEWDGGYDPRFGLVFVDYKTLKRIPKDSFYWYKNLIQNGGI